MPNPQDLIEELTQLAKGEGSLDEFYRHMLPRLTAHLGALGAAVWFCNDDSIRLLCQHGTDGPLVNAQDAERHIQLLSKVRIAGHPAYVLPKSADSLQGSRTLPLHPI